MNRKIVFTVLKITGAFLLIGVAVLAVHIYQVTRPPKADASTVAIARINFDEQLSTEDSLKICNWLYQQKGVDYALCNTESRIAVFSFHPFEANATLIAQNLSTNLHYKATRYQPTLEQMQSGCPVK